MTAIIPRENSLEALTKKAYEVACVQASEEADALAKHAAVATYDDVYSEAFKDAFRAVYDKYLRRSLSEATPLA